MIRTIIFPVLFVSLLPGFAAAQLQDTHWSETVTVSANEVNSQEVGQDIAMPEAISQNATDGIAGCTGNVSFGPPGPPQGTSTMSGFSESNGSDVTGVAVLNISFFARVVQTSTPDVMVTTVPVSISASGTADASGSWTGAQSFSDVTILLGLDDVFVAHVDASSNSLSGFPETDSFDESLIADIPVNGVLNGALIAQASITALNADSGGANASAFVDPVIEVADQVIPGSSASYRDHFQIEFGAGYYALGNPTPVEPTTWGRIKSLYDRQGRSSRP